MYFLEDDWFVLTVDIDMYFIEDDWFVLTIDIVRNKDRCISLKTNGSF